MSASLFDLLKYAQTGIASPGMTFYDKMRASVLMGGGRAETLTGIPPLTLEKSAGKPLKSWSMIGNIAQDGTPTPEQTVDVKMVGDRTANLFEVNSYFTLSGTGNNRTVIMNSSMRGGVVKLSTNTTYTISGVNNFGDLYFRIGLFDIEPVKDSVTTRFLSYNTTRESSITFTTSDEECYCLIFTSLLIPDVNDNDIMLSPGSTPLPYEPYGYKIGFLTKGKNLCPPLVAGLGLNSASGVEITNPNGFLSDYIPVDFDNNPKYALSNINYALHIFVAAYNENKEFLGRSGGTNGYTLTFRAESFANGTSTATGKIKFIRVYQYALGNERADDFVNKLMLVAGDTEQPYEPYQTPTTTPIYLGQTPTVRRVKKFVLDGTEDWIMSNSRFFLSSLTPDYLRGVNQVLAVCSHYSSSPQTSSSLYVPAGCISFSYSPTTQRLYCYDTSITTRADFKAYLAAQYAAGTPVTIWYVLATPETAIVNEPLAKIGDYADELHSTDAGVSIPTLKGTTIIDVDTEVNPSEMTVEYLV